MTGSVDGPWAPKVLRTLRVPKVLRALWVPKVLRALWMPTTGMARRVSGAVVLVLAAVVLTGAVVRLSGSGLGCPTWPSCTTTTLHSGTDVHGLIEFGNRVLSVAVFLVGLVLLALIVLRRRRRDLYAHVAALFAGYLAEAVLGGVSVLTRLDPLVVAAHFLLAIVLLWVAIVIWRRLGTQAVPPVPTVRVELRWLGRALVAASFAILVAGTLVTGTGPHAGSRVDNRLGVDRHDITQLHSDLVLLVVGAVAVTLLLLRLTGAPSLLRQRARTLLIVMVAQSVVGFVQYFTGLPAWLVGLHVVGATAFWAASLLLTLDMYVRPVAAAATTAAGMPADRSLAAAGRVQAASG